MLYCITAAIACLSASFMLHCIALLHVLCRRVRALAHADKLVSLRELNVFNNAITTLPTSIGQLCNVVAPTAPQLTA